MRSSRRVSRRNPPRDATTAGATCALLRVSALLLAAACAAWLGAPGRAHAQEKIVYLFPAPQLLPAFTPFIVAWQKGYYKDEQLDVEFKVVRGGGEVATKLQQNEADLGGATGDVAILVRPQGNLIRSVALLGGGSLAQMVMRKDAAVLQPDALRGKRITVASLNDSAYFALLGFLQSVGLRREDVQVDAVGPIGVFKNVIDRKADVMVGAPDWITPFKQAGVEIDVMQVGRFFPNMAQVIITSDRKIKERPRAIGGFVRATLRGFRDVLNDPMACADIVIRAFPAHEKEPEAVRDTVRYYARHVYPGQRILGEMNELRLTALQEFYLKEGIIPRATPVRELYTNQFVN
jgi:NitT/TauT family transport system substrate-binding protein